MSGVNELDPFKGLSINLDQDSSASNDNSGSNGSQLQPIDTANKDYTNTKVIYDESIETHFQSEGTKRISETIIVPPKTTVEWDVYEVNGSDDENLLDFVRPDTTKGYFKQHHPSGQILIGHHPFVNVRAGEPGEESSEGKSTETKASTDLLRLVGLDTTKGFFEKPAPRRAPVQDSTAGTGEDAINFSAGSDD